MTSTVDGLDAVPRVPDGRLVFPLADGGEPSMGALVHTLQESRAQPITRLEVKAGRVSDRTIDRLRILSLEIEDES
ncbi:MAG: hypothetical protein AAFX79_00160 [Planctomycetota bacterium]